MVRTWLSFRLERLQHKFHDHFMSILYGYLNPKPATKFSLLLLTTCAFRCKMCALCPCCSCDPKTPPFRSPPRVSSMFASRIQLFDFALPGRVLVGVSVKSNEDLVEDRAREDCGALSGELELLHASAFVRVAVAGAKQGHRTGRVRGRFFSIRIGHKR